MLVAVGAGQIAFHVELWPVVCLLGFVAMIGLVDDMRYLSIGTKLAGEVVIASIAVVLGFSWHLTDSSAINSGVSVLWMVGLMNSINLLDNADGLASSSVACSLAAIVLLAPPSAAIAVPLAGAAIGFLFFNRPPARMYMGDSGSLMLGLGVGMSSISASNTTHGLHSLVILAFPVAVALFDTSLVIVSRLTTSRPIQLGGQDHFSHRLKLLGWSPYQVIAAAVGGSIAGWSLAILALRYPRPETWLAIPIGVALLSAWVRLLQVDPYTLAVHTRVEVYRG
jgi:UDP-GlcNAc:undecaprenyl-phosphate GlcNAc-1-phosphate transferase